MNIHVYERILVYRSKRIQIRDALQKNNSRKIKVIRKENLATVHYLGNRSEIEKIIYNRMSY